MNYKWLLSIVCLFILNINGLVSANQNTLVISHDMQYEYAYKLFTAKDYDTAIVEFKRFVHFFPESKLVNTAVFNIALSRFYLKDYHEAARAFNDIIIKDEDDELTRKSVFFQSQAFILMGNTGYAQLVLQNYLKLSDDPDIKDQIYYNLAMIHLTEAKKGKAESLELARSYLDKISIKNTKNFQVENHIDLIIKAEQADKKNPSLAGMFAVIPGGGFLYCERYKDALVTFLLNASLMIAAYQAWDNDNEALAGVIGFVETGFYSANIYGAISSAHKFNRAQVHKFLDREFYLLSKWDLQKGGGLEITLNFPF